MLADYETAMSRGRTLVPMGNPWMGLSFWGVVVGLLLMFSALPLSSSSPERIEESESMMPFLSKGSVNFRTSKGVATMLSLEARNSSSVSPGRKRRALLGDSRMALHDDLLSKGYFTSNLQIGTPPADFALIVDTGSTVTYVPCSTCTHCGHHQDAAFTPSASSTYESIPCTSPLCNTGFCGDNKVCTYKRLYAEKSSSSGVLGRDVFGFGDDSRLEGPKLLFGCENEENGDLFFQKADGIMGLGRGPLSVVNQLVQEKRMADTFSLCYGGMDEKGGNMIMGDFEAPKGMVFTGSDPKRSPYYNVVLKQIKVAGKPIPVDPGVFDAKYGTVLDSGTTYAYLPERAFNAFKGAVLAQLKNLKPVAGPDPQYEDFCFQGAGSDPAKLRDFFPAVDLVFGDAVVPLEPENYLFNHTLKEGAYCLGVFKNDNDHTTLLGGILVRNMLVKYDRANHKIGFWRTKCTDLWTRLKDAYDNKAEPPPPPPPEVEKTAPPPPPVEEAPVPSAPDVTAVAPITVQHIGSLELNMSVTSNYSTFGSLSSVFVTDMARDLELEPHQVRLVGFHEQGADVTVICAVSPASTSSLSSRRVEDIIGRLMQHRVQLSSDLGSYKLEHWRVISEPRSSWGSSNYGLVAGVVVIVVIVFSVIVGIWLHRRSRDRSQKLRYTAIDPAGL